MTDEALTPETQLPDTQPLPSEPPHVQPPHGEPLRTHPLSLGVGAVKSLQNALFPMAALYFSQSDKPWAFLAAIGIGVLIAGLSIAFNYFSWRRLTYTVGGEDIRVESGVLSRAARSVPYERIQDVSIEQSLFPRMLGLVSVKFETGAGGADDLALQYLSEDEGERLRDVIKARKDGVVAATPQGHTEAEAAAEQPAEVIFAMNEKRLFIFGVFEFSLAIFAVVAGLFQYAETFASFAFLDPDRWSEWAEGSGGFLSGLGLGTQVLSAIAGLIVFFLVGSVTGLIRTFLRDWDFKLERTEKGFRRRRGMLTKTDVVMPIHRVQAIKVVTGFLRRRFGWFGLKFVSLAQDSGSASHDVAPFAKLDEIAPIADIAGFAVEPEEGADWQRGSRSYRFDSAVIEFLFLGIIAGGVAIGLALSRAASPLYALIILALGLLLYARQLFLWRFDFNAIDAQHFFVKRGWLAPKLDVASRIKLQSVEIARGPIAQRRGYATLRLGLAGGALDFEGLPVERAEELRTAIIASIAQTDFSQLSN